MMESSERLRLDGRGCHCCCVNLVDIFFTQIKFQYSGCGESDANYGFFIFSTHARVHHFKSTALIVSFAVPVSMTLLHMNHITIIYLLLGIMKI